MFSDGNISPFLVMILDTREDFDVRINTTFDGSRNPKPFGNYSPKLIHQRYQQHTHKGIMCCPSDSQMKAQVCLRPFFDGAVMFPHLHEIVSQGINVIIRSALSGEAGIRAFDHSPCLVQTLNCLIARRETKVAAQGNTRRTRIGWIDICATPVLNSNQAPFLQELKCFADDVATYSKLIGQFLLGW